jgi:hypothetical protein
MTFSLEKVLANRVELQQIDKLNPRIKRFLVVRPDGNIAGIVERFNDSRTERHPWKVFLGYGSAIKFAGVRWPLHHDRKGIELAKWLAVVMVLEGKVEL